MKYISKIIYNSTYGIFFYLFALSVVATSMFLLLLAIVQR